MKNKIYMVVANGKGKDSGKPYSKCYVLKSVQGTEYQYLDTRDTMYLEEVKPVGYKYEVVMTIK